MILRREDVPLDEGDAPRAAEFGTWTELRYSDAGGLGQFGAIVETLHPGARSSERHWHEAEDEFLYVLSGTPTVIEDDGEHILHPGDAACWPAGVPNAHCVVNRSHKPCSYLIVGSRAAADRVHYPDADRILIRENGTRRFTRGDGSPLE